MCDDRDALCHEIETHEIGYHRGEIELVGFDNGPGQEMGKEFPWVAPRVMLEYLQWDMGTDEPMAWSVDNYDGEEIWMEIGKAPHEKYKDDRQMNKSISSDDEGVAQLGECNGSFDTAMENHHRRQLQEQRMDGDQRWREEGVYEHVREVGV